MRYALSVTRSEMMNKTYTLDLIKYCSFLILFGSGLSYLTGEQAITALFDQSQILHAVFGVTLIFGSLALLFPTEYLLRLRLQWIVLPCTAILFLTTYAAFVKSDFVIEQIIEHGIKLFTPILFLILTQRKTSQMNGIQLALKMLIAMTFIGHGMFALGIHYVPGGFITMTTDVLGISAEYAYVLLKIVGIVDILCALLLFSPFKINGVYYYLIAWGLLTALARISFGIVNDGTFQELLYWSGNTIYRIPHGVIPLVLLQLIAAPKAQWNNPYSKEF